MEFEKIHNSGQARLFDNKYLEMLTKAHPLVIWGMYLPLIVYMLYYSHSTIAFTMGKVILLFIGGVFFWSLFEYIAHRFLFHMDPKSERGQKVIYMLHGNHHHYPKDRSRLFMPPVPSILISGSIFGMMYLTMGLNAMTFFPGFMFGYLLYGTVHYAIHSWRPPFAWMKGHWRNHHLHHYQHQHKGYGVSSTLWDHVFGTMNDLKSGKL